MSDLLMILFILFPTAVYGIYLLFPKKARPYCLLFFSIAFFAVYSKFMTIFLLLTILTVYLGGFGINKLNDKFDAQKAGLEKEERKALKKKFARKKRWLVAGIIVFNIGILAVLKYFNFFASIFEGFLSWFNVSATMPVLKLALPLGISYYTLTAIGYLIDVNRGKFRAGNFWQVALFISYFPQMYEGPFATYDSLSPQLQEGKGFDKSNFFGGVLLMLWGWFKKVVIADRLGIIASEVFSNFSQYNGLIVVLGVICFTFQLYAEFSGLIDVARGISEMFGIKLAKNFDQPFFSQSVSEFWRRWHMSLGAWLKNYIFYPVSMSKGMTKMCKKLQNKSPFWQVFVPSIFSLLAVWLICGIWHGSGLIYIVYGLYYYVLMLSGLICEFISNKFYTKTKINRDNIALKLLRIAKTFVLVNLGMLIFRAGSVDTAISMIGRIFSSSGTLSLAGVIDIYDGIFCVIGVALLFVADILQEKKIDFKQWFVKRHYAIKYAIILCVIVGLIVFGAYGRGYIPFDPLYGAF